MKGEQRQGRRILVRCLFWGICLGILGCVHNDAYIQQEAPIPANWVVTLSAFWLFGVTRPSLGVARPLLGRE